MVDLTGGVQLAVTVATRRRRGTTAGGRALDSGDVPRRSWYLRVQRVASHRFVVVVLAGDHRNSDRGEDGGRQATGANGEVVTGCPLERGIVSSRAGNMASL